MNKKLIWLSALALSMSVSQTTLACGCKTPAASGDRYEKMTEKLDLTAEQKVKIKAITSKAKKDMKPMLEEMRSIHMQLNELIASKDVEEAQVDKLIERKKELMGTMMKMKFMDRHDINVVLTEKQKAKMASMVSAWKEKHMKKD